MCHKTLFLMHSFLAMPLLEIPRGLEYLAGMGLPQLCAKHHFCFNSTRLKPSSWHFLEWSLSPVQPWTTPGQASLHEQAAWPNWQPSELFPAHLQKKELWQSQAHYQALLGTAEAPVARRLCPCIFTELRRGDSWSLPTCISTKQSHPQVQWYSFVGKLLIPALSADLRVATRDKKSPPDTRYTLGYAEDMWMATTVTRDA